MVIIIEFMIIILVIIIVIMSFSLIRVFTFHRHWILLEKLIFQIKFLIFIIISFIRVIHFLDINLILIKQTKV
jgi:hypothetical protein